MAIPLNPSSSLDRIELMLRQSRDSLCWAMVEDMGRIQDQQGAYLSKDKLEAADEPPRPQRKPQRESE